mgnify:CR=1 FL=1|tara:strand:+ start:4494 stop:5429 length:936 start_codon:yes stop_codon:yes gene_type:complete
MDLKSKIFVAGSETTIGKKITYFLDKEKYKNILTDLNIGKNLENYELIDNFFKNNKPDYVFLVAGKSGGIKANKNFPATIMINNLKIISNIMSLSNKYNVKKLLFLASSCVYPKNASNPLSPEILLESQLEETNKSYAIAKLSGMELCNAYRQEFKDNFISVIPSTVFGPGDNFSNDNSHVIPAMIKKIHDAKISKKNKLLLWGTGRPIRDFIYIDDLADGLIFLMNNYDEKNPINISSEKPISIKDLSILIKKIIGYNGEITFDPSHPDGMPIKSLNYEVIKKHGWQPKFEFANALKKTYEWYLSSKYCN